MKRYLTIILFLSLLLSAMAEQLPDLKSLLDAQKGKRVINIPKGKYLLDVKANGYYRFENLKDVEIKGNGSEIICNSQEQAIRFINCERVKFSGFSIDYDPLCFTQGTIVSMDPQGSWFEVEIHQGYPVEHIQITRTQFYDPNTRLLKKNSITTYSSHYSGMEKVGERRFRLLKKGNWSATEQIGDFVVMNVVADKKNRVPHAIQLEQCREMELEKIIVYGSNGFSFFEKECYGNHYNQCVVDRGPMPEGIEPRLRSGNLDGINSTLARKGPLVENCIVRHNGDDGIIVSGRSCAVIRTDIPSKSIYVLTKSDGPVFAKGDNIQIVEYSGVKKELLKVISIEDYTPTEDERQMVLDKYPSLLGKNAYTKGRRIKVDKIIDNRVAGDLLYNADRVGSGFVIRNNQVGSTRSRGILIKGQDGVIEGNTISNCAMQGILVAPEVNWMGGGFSSNVEIKNNTITDCMYEKSTSGMAPGAISVFCANGRGEVSPAGAFSRITIRENEIHDCPMPCVVYTSVDGINFQDNNIVPNPEIIREHGKAYGTDYTMPVWEKNNVIE